MNQGSRLSGVIDSVLEFFIETESHGVDFFLPHITRPITLTTHRKEDMLSVMSSVTVEARPPLEYLHFRYSPQPQHIYFSSLGVC